MQYKISFSEEKDFREIVDKLDLYFEKEPGYFENLVPVLLITAICFIFTACGA